MSKLFHIEIQNVFSVFHVQQYAELESSKKQVEIDKKAKEELIRERDTLHKVIQDPDLTNVSHHSA